MTLTWINGAGTRTDMTSKVDSDGNWQQQPPPLPPPGPYTVHAVQTVVLEGRTLTSAPVITNATIVEPAD